MAPTLLALLIAITPVDSLPDVMPYGYVPPPPAGVIEGRVVDARCGGPLAYGHVNVLGVGAAFSDRDGRFRMEGVPPGTHKLRAMGMFFETTVVNVEVAVDSTTRVDVMMRRPSLKLRVPPTATKRCQVHHKKMQVVCVSVCYGLRVVEPGYGEASPEFPNGDFSVNGGCVVGPNVPWRMWAYRCAECVQRRNEWVNGGEWAFRFDKAPQEWATYRIAGGVTFRAPAGLTEVSLDNSCVTTKDWSGAGIRVHADYGLFPHMPKFERSDTDGAVLVGNTMAEVHVWNASPGPCRVNAGFWAPPVGDRELMLSVEVDNEKSFNAACGVVGSVRFGNQ